MNAIDLLESWRQKDADRTYVIYAPHRMRDHWLVILAGPYAEGFGDTPNDAAQNALRESRLDALKRKQQK